MSIRQGNNLIAGTPDLSAKANTDLSNVSASDMTTAMEGSNTPVIVETYKNGNNWYRVWSDGWCEQGGVGPSGNDKETVTVTFLKALSSGYTVAAIQRDGPAGNYTNGLRIVNYSTNSFQINYRTGGTTTTFWVAFGYIAE